MVVGAGKDLAGEYGDKGHEYEDAGEGAREGGQ